jgi:hypothetical protein
MTGLTIRFMRAGKRISCKTDYTSVSILWDVISFLGRMEPLGVEKNIRKPVQGV